MSERFAPMGPGLEMDIESGEPVALSLLDRKSRDAERKQHAAERHARLLADLSGQGGEVLRQLAHRLAQRVDELVAQDPEASALFALLTGFGQQIRLGQRLVQQSLEEIGI